MEHNLVAMGKVVFVFLVVILVDLHDLIMVRYWTAIVVVVLSLHLRTTLTILEQKYVSLDS